MQLQLRTFSSLVTSAAAAVQGAASQLVDLTVGSTLRAVLEANASIALWLQWLILEVLQMTDADPLLRNQKRTLMWHGTRNQLHSLLVTAATAW
jgi:hypothetical protein